MAFKLLSAIRNQHFHSLLGNLISAFFNVLSFSILVRILSKPEFGDWVLFIATYNVLDQVRTALLQSGIIKFYAGTAHEVARKVAGAAWYIAIFLTGIYVLVDVILLLFAQRWFDGTWLFFLHWLGVLMILSLPFNFATWILQAEHRFEKIVHIRIMQNGSFMVLIAALYFFNQVSEAHVLYAYAISLALCSIYALYFQWTRIRFLAFRTKEQIKELYQYGSLIVGSMLTSSFLGYSDSFLIRTMINPAAVAIYSIPQKFMEVTEIILRSFVATAQPTLSAAVNRNDWRGAAMAFARYTGAVTIIILPFIVMMILLVKPLIIVLASSKYLPATQVVLIFLFSAIFYPIDRFIGVTLDMTNRPLINFYKNALKLAVNVVGDLVVLYLWHDIRAVAAVSFLNLLAGVIFGYYFIKKYLHFSFAEIFSLGWQEVKILADKILAKTPFRKKDAAGV